MIFQLQSHVQDITILQRATEAKMEAMMDVKMNGLKAKIEDLKGLKGYMEELKCLKEKMDGLERLPLERLPRG